ncbi:hypothetical protein [Amaricoccus tamworthensis]|uniref:hypothetical protein n=1 Tax=Amaricoccus tamworthensis TaxID=57002 RepID=UPI003C7B8E45
MTRTVIRRLIAIVTISYSILLPTAQAPAQTGQASDFSDFPFLIYCEYEKIGHAYYFSQLNPDGTAIFMTPDSQVGTITVNGVARRVDGQRSGSCSGKTLADLRAEKRAFDLLR